MSDESTSEDPRMHCAVADLHPHNHQRSSYLSDGIMKPGGAMNERSSYRWDQHGYSADGGRGNEIKFTSAGCAIGNAVGVRALVLQQAHV